MRYEDFKHAARSASNVEEFKEKLSTMHSNLDSRANAARSKAEAKRERKRERNLKIDLKEQALLERKVCGGCQWCPPIPGEPPVEMYHVDEEGNRI